jgi:crotonobetainyl-CoA:carnitine CoA-transferase CaiB-like acyl-CoA transferase
MLGIGAPYRLYEASGGWVFLACATPAEWARFCEAAGRADLASSWEAAWADGGPIAGAVAAVCRKKDASEWERFARERDLPLVAVEERLPGPFSLEDAELRAQGMMVQVHSATYGDYWRHGALHQFSEGRPAYGPWEPVGGHTRSILAELGYAEAEIARLIDEGTVEQAPDG